LFFWTFALENAVLLERAGASSELVHLGASDLSGVETFDFLSGLTVAAATASSTGTLSVTFTDGTSLSVEPSPDYEAWGAVAPDGVQYICLPGGEIATFGLPDPA